MICSQIYQVLLNKKKILLIFFLIFFKLNSYSIANDIYPIIKINNSLITNVDLKYEIEVLKMQYENKISNSSILKNIAIKNLIEENIKNQEVEKMKIIISDKILKNNIQPVIEKIKEEEIKEIVSKKIAINLKWSKMIKNIYINQININLSEIDEIVKKKKLNAEELKTLIINEKNKKLLKYSQSHFNSIKNNYLISFL